MRHKFAPKLAVVLCAAGLLAFASAARAQDDRADAVAMQQPAPAAPAQPAHGPAAAPAQTTPTPTKANAVPPPPGHRSAPPPATTASVSGSLVKVESFGTLTDAKSGGLGSDMWDGSTRPNATALIRNLPDATHYRIANAMIRRALLTAADTSLLDEDATPAPGEDLLTLRIRKLMEMGALDDAATLYKDDQLPPHDAAMAAAGVTALLADAQPSLACLETKAFDKRFSGTPEWAPLDAFCDYLIGRLSGHGGGAVSAGGTTLQQMAGNAGYRYHVQSLRDFDKLPVYDRVILAADHRVDYAASGADAAGLSPLTLAVIEHDTSAPLTLRFNLLIAGARTGIFDENDIAEFYKAIPFTNLAQTDAQVSGTGAPGWQRVAWLYKSGDTQHGLIDKTVLAAALPLRVTYGDIALWPFAPLLQTVEPAGFGGDAARGAVLIALQAGDPVPESWGNAWKSAEAGRAGDVPARVAFGLSGNPGANLSENLLSEINGLPKQSTELLTVAVKELDKGKKLHNINDAEGYGNVTTTNPSDATLDGLKAAENDHRLGEVVLLASVALGDKTPDNLPPELFRAALNGYRIVGLNKEARALAVEVALGLK